MPEESTGTKATPGPWWCVRDTYCNSTSPRIRVFGKNSRGIGEVFYRTAHDPADEPEPNANAALIVAAPDLLAACKAAQAFLEMIGNPSPPAPWIQIRDAVRKAEARAV